MAYKGLFGLGEVAGGVALSIPAFDPASLFRRLAAAELREDPGDRFVATVSRLLPSLVVHRLEVAILLLALGVAKLIAVAGMWNGREWGGWLLLAAVAAALPFDVHAAIARSSPLRTLVASLNVVAVGAIAVLLRTRSRRPA
jgi:uncharacterized membrane protein